MSKVFRNLWCSIATIVFIVSVMLYCTYCWDSINQTSTGLVSGESNISIDVELLLREKNNEQVVIPGTVFYLFNENGEQIGGQYITDKEGKISVSLNKGNYYFEEITPVNGYTFDEIDGQKITKYPFTITCKEEEKVVINAYNIRLNGSLLINKIIKNVDNSLLTDNQLNTEFEFIVTFSNDLEYTYRIDDTEQTLKSGDKLKLKHGQTAVFEKIPLGVFYTVTEEKKDDYIITSLNHQGNITSEGSNVIFTNIYDSSFIPNEDKVKLSITKKLEGEYLEIDEQKEFEFVLLIDGKETKFTLKKNETKEFDIQIGSNYEIKEKNYFYEGYQSQITNSYGTAYKDNIEVIATNTYVGEVKTIISGEKKWNVSKDIPLPEYITVRIKNGNLVVQEKQVKKDSNGKWSYEFVVPKYDLSKKEIKYKVEEKQVDGFTTTYDGYNIINTYIEPIKVELPTIYKMTYGDNIPLAKFEFILKGKNVPMPNGSKDGMKIVNITGRGETNFGEITFKNPGTYKYKIYELNGGIKGWKYDKKVYEITVTITLENGKLYSKVSFDGKSKDNPNVSFNNYYDETKSGINIIISGSISWNHGNNKLENIPNFVIINVFANDKLVLQKQITQKDNWKFSFELPKYDEKGKLINYTIDEEDISDYKKVINGFDISNEFIDLNVIEGLHNTDNITYNFLLLLVSGILLLILFLIKFKKKKIVISGVVTWDHRDNTEKIPKIVAIAVCNKGKIVEKQIITEEDKWKFKFKLPKYDENNDEIIYTVYQNKINNYETTKDNNNFNNKYIK